ncbi:hypothetical protein Pmani_017147 [Petrolisthes manimaculis]|uniref:Uncharacterized protein n=1 Tax=Petrolisthes manimaculis TaxID=1843537 RepID=A0AAE1PQS0_9EUCA|nr:hypothetical protein Pmani_017147 [Petrolisthes manimaculis]
MKWRCVWEDVVRVQDEECRRWVGGGGGDEARLKGRIAKGVKGTGSKKTRRGDKKYERDYGRHKGIWTSLSHLRRPPPTLGYSRLGVTLSAGGQEPLGWLADPVESRDHRRPPPLRPLSTSSYANGQHVAFGLQHPPLLPDLRIVVQAPIQDPLHQVPSVPVILPTLLTAAS